MNAEERAEFTVEGQTVRQLLKWIIRYNAENPTAYTMRKIEAHLIHLFSDIEAAEKRIAELVNYSMKLEKENTELKKQLEERSQILAQMNDLVELKESQNG